MARRGNVEKIILDFAKAVCEGERTMIDEKKVELMKNSKQAAPFPSMVVIFRGAGM